MASEFDVCIRGAGIVGRSLALLLARERMRVALVDTAPAPSNSGHGDVRAYALNQLSREVLQSVRSWPEAQYATPVTRMDVYGDQGGEVHFDAAQQHTEALNWIVDVPALEAQLAAAESDRDHLAREPSLLNSGRPPRAWSSASWVCESMPKLSSVSGVRSASMIP